jgi:hypothetical protein
MVIVTEPSGAMVHIDDATHPLAAGPSPITIYVPQGAQIRIHAELIGFTPVNQAITVGNRDRQTIRLPLTPAAHAAPQLPAPTTPATPPIVVKPGPKPPRPPTKPREPDDTDEIIK